MTIRSDQTRDAKGLAARTANALRDIVFAADAGAFLGSLQDLSKQLGVGIITLQQAARVLEHEGLITSRRGPKGGYFGARPGDAALERAIAAYLRSHPASFEEAVDMTSLLFNELVAAAAKCEHGGLRNELRALIAGLDDCDDTAKRGAFESAFQDLLFKMVERPLFELMTRVTLHVAGSRGQTVIDPDPGQLEAWKAGRKRIGQAILDGDAELAHFEAIRSNRRLVMRRLRDGAVQGD